MMVPGPNGETWWMHRSRNRTFTETRRHTEDKNLRVSVTLWQVKTMSTLPYKLQEIVNEFAGMSREEKLEALLKYADSLPPSFDPLDSENEKMESVPECVTPVQLFSHKQADGGVIFHFEIPPESPTVRGLAAILASGLNGAKPEEILAVPADFYLPMNLQEAVTHQRLNGFTGMLVYMKQAAVKMLED